MAFQNITPVKLGQAAIGVTVSTLYTVPASTRTFVKDIDIANTGTSATTATVYLVPSAGTAGTSNMLVPGVTIPPSGMFQWTGNQIMNAGDTIQIVAGVVGCTINASGGEAV